MDARTGEIRVGWRNQCRKVFQGTIMCGKESAAGSTFKLLFTARDRCGFVPAGSPGYLTTFQCREVNGFENAGGDYGTGRSMTLRETMAKSVNSLLLMMTVTPANVVEFAPGRNKKRS